MIGAPHGRWLAALTIACAIATPSAMAQDACAPDGRVRYLCGLGTVEDLVAVRGTRWIIGGKATRERDKDVGFYLVDSRAGTVTEILPDFSGTGAAPYTECPGPPDPKRFFAHGITLRHRGSGPHDLYAVNHGGRESVEVFALDVTGAAPTIRWKGCLLVPPNVSANGIADLPDGGIAVTSFGVRGDPSSFEKMLAGQPVGGVVEWHPGAGWTELPNTAFPGDNGIVATPDGATLFVASWQDATVRVVPRAGSKHAARSIALGDLHPDNIHLAPSGDLLVAGQIAHPKAILDCARAADRQICDFPYRVVTVNPASLTVTTLIDEPGSPRFGGASAAAIVGTEIWIGTFRGTRIARIALPR